MIKSIWDKAGLKAVYNFMTIYKLKAVTYTLSNTYEI